MAATLVVVVCLVVVVVYRLPGCRSRPRSRRRPSRRRARCRGVRTPEYAPVDGPRFTHANVVVITDRHAAARPPRPLRRAVRDRGRLPPGAGGRAVRARGLAGPPDAAFPRVALHGPLPSPPRGARQRRLRAGQRRHDARGAAPRPRLPDRGLRRLLRPPLPLGHRPGVRDLRRLLRLLRAREPQPDRRRAARRERRGPRARAGSARRAAASARSTSGSTSTIRTSPTRRPTSTAAGRRRPTPAR